MVPHAAIDLDPKDRETILALLQEHVPGCEVRAYGSRAKWTATATSDLDLAVIGAESVGSLALYKLREAFEESYLPFSVDVMDWGAMPGGFRQEISQEYVLLQPPEHQDEWRRTTLGEFAPFVYGKSLPARARSSGGPVRVYGSNGIVGSHDTPLTDGPTVIVGRKGSIGAVHFSAEPCWPIDTTFYVQDNDLDIARFKYYALSVLGLEEMNTDSAVPGLNRTAAHARTMRLPTEMYQRRIASVLGALDDKIELNRRMCETLEGMAQGTLQGMVCRFRTRASQDGRPMARRRITAGSSCPPVLPLRRASRRFPARLHSGRLARCGT